jgi:hypothetical protein
MTTSHSQAAVPPGATAIPVPVSAKEFVECILPPLSLPQRGPQGKSGYHNPFNSLLKVLYPGRQWQELPSAPGPAGKAALHYPGGFKLFARGAEEGSLERAFGASVKQLDAAHKLALSLLPGDGANTVAKKGALLSGRAAPNTRRGRK